MSWISLVRFRTKTRGFKKKKERETRQKKPVFEITWCKDCKYEDTWHMSRSKRECMSRNVMKCRRQDRCWRMWCLCTSISDGVEGGSSTLLRADQCVSEQISGSVLLGCHLIYLCRPQGARHDATRQLARSECQSEVSRCALSGYFLRSMQYSSRS